MALECKLDNGPSLIVNPYDFPNLPLAKSDNVITFYKALEDTIKLDLDKTNAYTVVMIQNGKSTQIVVNGGGNSSITITQGD
jgi:hypothetical protein